MNMPALQELGDACQSLYASQGTAIGAITLAVSTTGSDNSPNRPQVIRSGDYSSRPFATTAAALAALPRQIVSGSQVTIQIGPGGSFNLDVNGFSGSGTLIIQGSTSDTAGASGSAGPGTSSTTIVKPAGLANWTPGALVGKLLILTSGPRSGTIRPVKSNTTTTITVDAVAGMTTGDGFKVCIPSSMLSPLSPDDATCIRVSGNMCKVVLRTLGFSSSSSLDRCVESFGNAAFEAHGLVLDQDTALPSFDSHGDLAVTLADSVLKTAGDVQIQGALAVTLYDLYCNSAGSIVVQDCLRLVGTSIESTGASSSVVRCLRINSVQLELNAHDGTATPLYLESIGFFEAIGANRLSGGSNSGGSTYGIEIALSGRYVLTGSTISGAAGDVLFMGRAVTWANLSSATYGIAEEHAGSAIANSAYTKSLKYGSVLFMDNVDVSGRLLLYGYLNQSANLSPLTAAGSNASTALDLEANGVRGFAEFGTVASGTGCRLPSNAAIAGVLVGVYNGGANALTVYPPTGGTIDGGASVSVAPGKCRTFFSLNGSSGKAFCTAGVSP